MLRRVLRRGDGGIDCLGRKTWEMGVWSVGGGGLVYLVVVRGPWMSMTWSLAGLLPFHQTN